VRVDRRGVLASVAGTLCASVLLSLSLGLACGPGGPERSFECPAPERVTRVEDVHYEGVDCDEAIASAESRLTTAYYRKACEQLAPRAGLPARVDDAYVESCRDADEGGSTLTVELCCPGPRSH
jgi:hypothetical protein